MNHHGFRLAALLLFTGTMIAAPAVAQQGADVYLELAETQKSPIPANCSTWHELYPAFCNEYHQDWYIDNDEDGEVSVCDYMQLNGEYYHVEWAGPTYYLTCGSVTGIWEPFDPGVVANPTCQMWHRIVPFDPAPVHVDAFQDVNQDGTVSPCDTVVLGGVSCHIDDIRLNVVVRAGVPVPGESETWGSVKSRY